MRRQCDNSMSDSNDGGRRVLRWTPQALDELEDIIDYVEERNVSASRRLRTLIEAAADRACRFPMAFRSGRVDGTRELVTHPNYLLVFAVGNDEVAIVNVVHTRRQYP